ncbi:MAG TPA: NAD-binding protein [Micropepsaceae bacterium]|nr:NAD-binding protein [Micropepsaceae bacterium]
MQHFAFVPAESRALATVLPNAAANVFITLSARSLNPGIEIIARGEVFTTESKLLQAGANRGVLPTHMARNGSQMILYPKGARIRARSRAGRQSS